MTVYGDMSALKGHAASKWNTSERKVELQFQFRNASFNHVSFRETFNQLLHKQASFLMRYKSSVAESVCQDGTWIRPCPLSSITFIFLLSYFVYFSTISIYIVYLQAITSQRPIISLRQERKRCNNVKLPLLIIKYHLVKMFSGI
jgi:hypothetical protein